jgi:hypothetical protein
MPPRSRTGYEQSLALLDVATGGHRDLGDSLEVRSSKAGSLNS